MQRPKFVKLPLHRRKYEYNLPNREISPDLHYHQAIEEDLGQVVHELDRVESLPDDIRLQLEK